MSPPGPPRPRASATAGITKGTAHGIASATTVSAGRRSHRKVVPLFCTSLPPGSVRRAAATVGTVFRCVASRKRGGRWARQPSLRAKKRVSQFCLPVPVEPQPSRGESISFLSPAQAAEAPTFCHATESRQRTQPRGLPPPWLTPNVFWPALSESSALRPPPLRLCKTPVGVPSGTAEDGDAKHRDELYKTSPPRNQPQA